VKAGTQRARGVMEPRSRPRRGGPASTGFTAERVRRSASIGGLGMEATSTTATSCANSDAVTGDAFIDGMVYLSRAVAS